MKKELIKQKCPKCGGNLYLERDYYTEGLFASWYEQETCLQCGFACSQESLKPVASPTVVAKGTDTAAKQLVTV
jgi:predicted nucleic-acid-binding Zn-ribbon protein